MQSGAINSEALTQLFRSLSQKRKFGTLELLQGKEKLEISFQNGKIVRARNADLRPWQPILERLIRAGLAQPELAELATARDPEIKELENFFVKECRVPVEAFKRARRGVELDILYSLRNVSAGSYNFRAEMSAVDESSALNIAPGQLLLDYVELENDLEQFAQVFDRLESTSTTLSRRNGSTPGNLPEAARVVWNSLEAESCLKQICDLTMLSEYELRESLNTLFVKNLLSVNKSASKSVAPVKAPAEVEEGAALLDAWKHSMDDLEELTEEDQLMSAAAQAEAPVKGAKGLGDRSILVDQAAELLSGLDDEQRPTLRQVSAGGEPVAEDSAPELSAGMAAGAST